MSDPITKLDAGQVLQLVLDEDNRRLRTDTTINTENLVINVALTPDEDGVHVADKVTGDLLKINPDGSLDANSSTTPTLVNLELELANTEYFYNLPVNTRKLTIRARSAVIKLAFTPGGTTSAYLTINRGVVYSEENIKYTGAIFLSSNKPDEVIEILSWA